MNDRHPDTGTPRPNECCGACPPIKGGGWDCTCPHTPTCPPKGKLMPIELRWHLIELTGWCTLAGIAISYGIVGTKIWWVTAGLSLANAYFVYRKRIRPTVLFRTGTIYAYATGHDPGIQIKHPKEN